MKDAVEVGSVAEDALPRGLRQFRGVVKVPDRLQHHARVSRRRRRRKGAIQHVAQGRPAQVRHAHRGEARLGVFPDRVDGDDVGMPQAPQHLGLRSPLQRQLEGHQPVPQGRLGRQEHAGESAATQLVEQAEPEELVANLRPAGGLVRLARLGVLVQQPASQDEQVEGLLPGGEPPGERVGVHRLPPIQALTVLVVRQVEHDRSVLRQLRMLSQHGGNVRPLPLTPLALEPGGEAVRDFSTRVTVEQLPHGRWTHVERVSSSSVSFRSRFRNRRTVLSARCRQSAISRQV